MPEDWEIGYLENIADITMGQSPDGKSYNENKMGMLFFQGRAEFGFRYPAEHLYTTEPKRLAQKNDILLSVRAPVGDINIAAKRCCIGRGLAAISSKNNFNSFLLYTMLSLKSTLDLYNGEGTVFGSINRDSLNELKITLPAQNIIANFERLVFPIDIMIKNNCQSIVFLKTLRDTLLPKFMTGENEDVSSLNYHLTSILQSVIFLIYKFNNICIYLNNFPFITIIQGMKAIYYVSDIDFSNKLPLLHNYFYKMNLLGLFTLYYI